MSIGRAGEPTQFRVHPVGTAGLRGRDDVRKHVRYVALVLLSCLCLLGSVAPPAPIPESVVVWWPMPCDGGYSVYVEVRGLPVTAWVRDEAEALRLYAALAGRMVGGE
jgi:hypothetical protein